MIWTRRLSTSILGMMLVAMSSTATFAQAAPQVLPIEPRGGTLNVGQSVLVDDGSCGAGRVKKLTRMVSMGSDGYRKSECIPYKKK